MSNLLKEIERNIFIEELVEDINDGVKLCYTDAYNAGWHDKSRERGTMLMLIVSEVAEAMEGARKDIMDDKLPHRKMEEVELADVVIRVMDYCGKFNLDLGGAMKEKLEYNRQRADHRPENRVKEGGKQW